VWVWHPDKLLAARGATEGIVWIFGLRFCKSGYKAGVHFLTRGVPMNGRTPPMGENPQINFVGECWRFGAGM